MLSLPPSMVLLVYVQIMNVRGGAGGSSSGVVVMVYMPQTTAPPTHVKSLAYTWRTYAQCEIFTFKAHIWSTQLQAFNCCYEHILSKFRPNTIDLLYMHTVYKTYILLLDVFQPTYTQQSYLRQLPSFLTHKPTNHHANAVRIHWLFHKYFRHEEYPNIFLRWIWFICAIREEII